MESVVGELHVDEEVEVAEDGDEGLYSLLEAVWGFFQAQHYPVMSGS